MPNPWEALCKELSSGPTRSLSPLPCFNSVKIDGLTSVKLGFIPDERLLACRTCGVMFLRDKALSHYDAFHECSLKNASKPDLLPYHAINLCQKLYEASQLQEKVTNKRLKSDSIRKSKSLRNLSHVNHFDNNSVPSTSEHQRKRVKLKPQGLNHSTVVCASLERDKLSSSSSYDRLSSGEVNSPGSGTESSSSAPSKLIENPPDPPSGFPRKGLMEILQEESASSTSKTRRICGGLTKPLPPHQLNLSVSALVNSHSHSYPSSPASPHICERKEATYVPSNVHSTRKQISVKTMQCDHVETSNVRTTNQPPNDPQATTRIRSQFDSCMPHPMSFKQQRVVRQPPPLSIESVETIGLVPGGSPNIDTKIPQGGMPSGESAAAVFHLEQESRMQVGVSQLMRANRLPRNGSNVNLSDYLHVTSAEQSWDVQEFSSTFNTWPRNSISIAGANYYSAFVDVEPTRAQQTGKPSFNSNLAMYDQASRNSPDPSMRYTHCVPDRSMELTSGRLHRQHFQNDNMINSLTQCGCVEMGDLRCKNSILCTTHTLDEKRRVPRSRDLKVLIHEARLQQQLMRIHETTVPSKIRRVSSSSAATPSLPTATSATAASLMASTSRSGLTPALPSAHRLPTASDATMPARRVSVNGVVTATVEGQSTNVQQQQQPTVLHRRVHHPSSLLRRNQQIWGQEKSSTDFSSSANATAAFYSPSGVTASLPTPPLPPPSSAMTKMAREVRHLGGVSEVQSRVVVNDEREKSITGRSRKSSRSGVRQPTSSMHNPYIQHLTAAPSNRANSTTVLLRASAAKQIAAKLRGAATTRGSTGIASTTGWMGYNRSANVSDIQLTAPTSTATASRHSTSAATVSGPVAVANPNAFGSTRLIFIGPKSLRKPDSASRLTVVPGLNIIQTPHQQHHRQQHSQPSSTLPIIPTPMSLEPPRELIIDPVGIDDDVDDVEVAEAAAELEAAAAASAIVSASNDVDSVDHRPRQPPFSRNSGSGSNTHHPTNLRPCGMPAGQMLVFHTRRL